MIRNPLFDLEDNLPDELFSTSGGAWGASTVNVSQPSNQQQQQQQQQCVQRQQSIMSSNAGMGMSMGMGPGTQNGSLDVQHQHHMMPNKTSMNNMSGGAISASAIGQNNLNLTGSGGLIKGPHNSKLNSPPGSAGMMMNSMGNGPQMMNMQQQQQQQQTMNNMLNPSMAMGLNNSGNVPMKTPVSMMNTGQMGQNLHNGPMLGNTRPVGGVPNNMMQQQTSQQQAPLRGQLIQGINPQGPRLQVWLLMKIMGIARRIVPSMFSMNEMHRRV